MKGLLRVLAPAGLVWVALTTPGLAAPAPAPQLRQSSADFDGDGAVDAAGLSASGDLTLRLAGASTRLELHQSILGFAIADLDHDGDRDVVALSAKGSLHFWYNIGGGRFRHERVSVNVARRGLAPLQASVKGAEFVDRAAEPAPRRLAAVLCAAPRAWSAGEGRLAVDLSASSSPRAPGRSLSSPRAPPLSTPA